MSNEELAAIVLSLIEILQGACTQYSEAGSGDDMHEHNLFDNVDMDNLDELRDRIINPDASDELANDI